MTFGEKLQKLRKEKGMSQEELAEKIMVTRQTISKWELNQSTPELEFISQLSDILEVTTDYLIKNHGEETSDMGMALENPKPEEKNENVLSQPERTHEKSGSPRFAAQLTIGILLTAMGAVGVIVLLALSVGDPWTVFTSWGTFEGFPGFLLGRNVLWLFVVFLLMGITGIGYCGYLAFRKPK